MTDPPTPIANASGLPVLVVDPPAVVPVTLPRLDVPAFTVDPPSGPDVDVLPVSGPPGPAGQGSTSFDVTAATVLSGHRVVRADTAGNVVYASNLTASDATADLWVTLTAADAGTPVTVQPFGRISEPSWSWQPGPIWLGVNGALTQVMPSAPAFLRQVGTADGPTAMFVNPRPALILA